MTREATRKALGLLRFKRQLAKGVSSQRRHQRRGDTPESPLQGFSTRQLCTRYASAAPLGASDQQSFDRPVEPRGDKAH